LREAVSRNQIGADETKANEIAPRQFRPAGQRYGPPKALSTAHNLSGIS
jgi:hypothetical protein